MKVETIDEKWRVTIPKEVRKKVNIFPKMPVGVTLERNRIIITPLLARADRRKADSLTWLLEHPTRADPKKLKKIDLEKMEDEMWLP